MCGITGIFNRASVFNNNEQITHNMLEAISHRGKDQSSVVNYSSCTVGFNRLAITDISSTQPFSDEWTVYLNGEIYNYLDLGYDGSECEVLSKGFEREGLSFVEKLNGMFIILAIKGDNVYLIRDRYGIKPMYYYTTQNQIIFSSEIKAITKHPEFSFSINDEVKRQWLVFNNCLTCDTLFDGVKKLDKGTIWHLNSDSKIKYWEWIFSPVEMSYDFAVSEVKRLVTQAINRQIPREVKYGSCLSGGIDSNIIAAVCGNIDTYTVGFTEGSDESTLPKVKSNNHIIHLSSIEFFDETIYHLEDLRVGASWSNYCLYKRASEDIKVLFDGAGSDEIFGGYSWRYSAQDYYDVVNRTKVPDQLCEQIFSSVFTEDTLSNRYKFDAEYFLEGILLVCDKLSMAHTIELRVPFLDNDLVDFCLTLPNKYKINKKVLKDAFSDLLSEEILSGKKLGFSSPDWFPGEGNQAKKWSESSLKKWIELYETNT